MKLWVELHCEAVTQADNCRSNRNASPGRMTFRAPHFVVRELRREAIFAGWKDMGGGFFICPVCYKLISAKGP